MLLFLHLGCLVVNFVLGLWKYFVFNYSFSISITKIPPCVCVHFVSYFKKFAQEMVETSCIYSSNNPIWYFLLIYMNECVVHLGLKGFCFCVYCMFLNERNHIFKKLLPDVFM